MAYSKVIERQSIVKFPKPLIWNRLVKADSSEFEIFFISAKMRGAGAFSFLQPFCGSCDDETVSAGLRKWREENDNAALSRK